jgi:hypothetical protein
MLGRPKCVAAKPSNFEVEIATEKVKSYKSRCTDQIPAEFINARDNVLTLTFISLLFRFCMLDMTPWSYVHI